MASVSLPHLSYAPINHASPNPSHFLLRQISLSPPHQKRLCAASRVSVFQPCRCAGRTNDHPSDSSSYGMEFGWHLSDKQLREIAGKVTDPLVQAARSAGKRFQDYLNSYRGGVEEAEVAVPEVEEEVQWDWDRWKRHFAEVEEQERMVSVLKAQLRGAVQREDYDEAAKLKVAIAAAATNDTVGKVVSHLNRAVKEERYEDAVFIRDEAGAGLLGWWFGISENSTDPYGRIIHISAAHGRYLAKSYSSRQLATASPGIPLFEIYVTVNSRGEYLQQAVYLKKNRDSGLDFPVMPSKSMDDSDTDLLINSTEENVDMKNAESQEEGEDVENKDDNDIDVAEGLTGVLNILRDMIPGAKIKVLKVVSPGKVDKDLISKVFEQIIEEEDEEEKDMELTPVGSSNEVNMESGQDEAPTTGSNDSAEDENQIAVKLVIGGLVQKLSSSKLNVPTRMPAKLQRRNRLSFLFHIEKDENEQEIGASVGKSARRPARQRIGLVTSDFAKVLARGDKVPGKKPRLVFEI